MHTIQDLHIRRPCCKHQVAQAVCAGSNHRGGGWCARWRAKDRQGCARTLLGEAGGRVCGVHASLWSSHWCQQPVLSPDSEAGREREVTRGHERGEERMAQQEHKWMKPTHTYTPLGGLRQCPKHSARLAAFLSCTCAEVAVRHPAPHSHQSTHPTHHCTHTKLYLCNWQCQGCLLVLVPVAKAWC